LAATYGAAELRGGLLASAPVDVGDRDRGPTGRQPCRDGEADALRRTSDDGGPSGEIAHGSLMKKGG
jgi:hypothetical protein